MSPIPGLAPRVGLFRHSGRETGVWRSVPLCARVVGMDETLGVCDWCGGPIRWVRVSRKAAGRWTHVRGRVEPGPRPWHRAAHVEPSGVTA